MIDHYNYYNTVVEHMIIARTATGGRSAEREKCMYIVH